MTFIDLFAGIGGFRRGLELAGHKCIGFCEWDKYATASYISMHCITEKQKEFLKTLNLNKRQKEILKSEYLNGEWYANDIRNVNAWNIPKADCWTFGAPCQDFSIAGKRAGLAGERSSLIQEVFRILEELKEENKPEWLIYENVKGMFSSNRGLDYLSIVCEMDRLGYNIEWQNINSKWFVPQNRERIYTIGHIRGNCGGKIFPITGTNGENSIQLIGKINSSQDGKIHAIDSITKCHSAGHNNSPKVAIPVIAPDRTEKKQNGRRFKENNEPMFTLTAQDRHGVAIKALGVLKNVRTEYGKKIRKDYEDKKLNISRHSFLAYDIRNDGNTNTLSTVQKDNYIAIKPISISGYKICKSEKISHCLNANDQRKIFGAKQERTVVSVQFPIKDKYKGVFVEMPGRFFVYAVWYPKYNCYIAIRKLTPKECFRLQGWTDDYFEKAAFVNSDSQLYKQAGNGVTVNVVQAIGERIKEIEEMT